MRRTTPDMTAGGAERVSQAIETRCQQQQQQQRRRRRRRRQVD